MNGSARNALTLESPRSDPTCAMAGAACVGGSVRRRPARRRVVRC